MEKDEFSDSLHEIDPRLAYCRTEVMLYFEKHNIFQIVYDLMLMLDRNRPECIEKYIAENIWSIAKKYDQINTFINISENVDLDSIRKSFKSSFVVAVENDYHLETSLQRLNLKLNQVNLNDKNLIFLGDAGMLGAIKRIFHVHLNLYASNSNLKNTNEEITQRSNLLKISPLHPVVQNAQRILILGPPGCGKHRIGGWLSQRLGAYLVSTTDLLKEHVRKMDCLGRALSVGSQQNTHTSELLSAIVQRRLLKLECLRSGWILVDFPNTRDDVLHFFSLPVTPNKVLVINTDESTCRRRKLKRNIEPASWKNMVIQAEMHFYNFNQQSILEGLKKQSHCAILQIDGNRSYRNIQKTILKKLMVKQNV